MNDIPPREDGAAGQGETPAVAVLDVADAERHRKLCLLVLTELTDAVSGFARAALVNDVQTRTTLVGPIAARLDQTVATIRERVLPPRG